MDAIFEIICEMYLGLWEALIPDLKMKTWQKWLFSIIGIIISLATLAALVLGVMFLINGENQTTAIILTSVGGVFFILHIVLFIYVLKRRR